MSSVSLQCAHCCCSFLVLQPATSMNHFAFHEQPLYVKHQNKFAPLLPHLMGMHIFCMLVDTLLAPPHALLDGTSFSIMDYLPVG